jgi:glyoxylate/hydroxypyruvate reductase A
LPAFLARTDVLVCLLPLTQETRGILGEQTLRQLPVGAALVQVGRGDHLDLQALLRLLDEDHLHCAMLDVTEPEPLPPEDPLWRHPKVRITPHVASRTRPETAVLAVLENIRRYHAGEPMAGEVDRHLGY